MINEHMMTPDQLKAFEQDIANAFNNKEIRAPIHLYDGTENIMRFIFNMIEEDDWVCCTWRNHYQALLKGIPPEIVKREILKGNSMVMNLPEYKFICSSIVGGIQSIATGLALAAKLNTSKQRVWVWSGDMSSMTGAWAEAYNYSDANDLPIVFIVEDNESSVLTPTETVWGKNKWYLNDLENGIVLDSGEKVYVGKHIIYYQYKNTKWPHAGAGTRIQF